MSTEMIARLPLDQLGGARVFRPCTIAQKPRRSGDVVSAEDIQTVSRQNLKSLIDQRFLVVWPALSAPPATDEEVFVYNRIGTSRYDVVVGHRINDEPLPKADAEVLAESARKKPIAA